MEYNIRRGKIILLSIICIILSMEIIVMSILTIKLGLYRLPNDVLRFLFTSILMYYTYRGKIWAKNINIVLLVFTTVNALINCKMSILLNPLMILLIGVYSISAILLIFSRDVNCFLREEAIKNKNDFEEF